jgi:fatty acid synthase subunit alpha, fungi type
VGKSTILSQLWYLLVCDSATALQSLEIACDTLLSGKAKVMIAGGFDDVSEEGSYEFANMKATSNAQKEFAMGREPTEMSRPTTTTRSGVS